MDFYKIDDERESVYLFATSRAGVVISIDSALHLFLSQTRGLSTHDQRTQLRFDNPILRQIAEALEAVGRAKPGGRVFLISRGVYYKEGFRRVGLIPWN